MADDSLKKLLNKQKQPPAGEAPAGEKPIPEGRHITLSDGSVVALDDLRPDEKRDVRRQHLIQGPKRKRSARRERQLPALFVQPEWVKRAREAKAPTKLQKRYRDDVVDMKTLTAPTPDVLISKNPQGLDRYILWTDIVACKNGFLYYTLPLVISIIFFIINLARKEFWPNAIFSVLCLVNFLTFRYAIKNVQKITEKCAMILMMLCIDAGAYYLALQYPEFTAGIDLLFAFRMLLIVFSIYHFGKFYVFFAMPHSG